MSEPVYLDLGLLKVHATPVSAWAGYADRVYARNDAIIDIATQELAKLWLRTSGADMPTFAQMMSWIALNPDVIEAALRLVRFKTASSPP